MRSVRLFLLLASFVAASAPLAGCEGDAFYPDAQVTLDTVTLTIPGSDAPSAVDLARIQPPFALLRRPELVQDAGEWDFALRRSGAGLVLRPYDAPGSPYRGAGIAVAQEDFEALDEAPRGTGAYVFEPVAATAGASYLMRSRQYPAGGGLCVKYAKAKVLALDAAAGTARVVLAVNENCDDERLTEDD